MQPYNWDGLSHISISQVMAALRGIQIIDLQQFYKLTVKHGGNIQVFREGCRIMSLNTSLQLEDQCDGGLSTTVP